MENKKAVLFATNGGDLDRMELAIRSLEKYMCVPYDLVIMSECEQARIRDHALVLKPEETMASVGFSPDGWNRHWPYATLYRMAIPLMPELAGYERVLYLDTDVMARSADVNDLLTVDLDGYEVVGVQDSYIDRSGRIRWVMDGDLSEEAVQAMRGWLWDRKRTYARIYMNAGVTVWNIPKIRTNGLDWYRRRLKWFWEAETRGKFSSLDQDFINVMMDSSGFLSVRYNWLGGNEPQDVVMQHFVAGCKGGMWDLARREGYIE